MDFPEKSKVSFDETNFQEIENAFKQVMSELSEDQNFEKFRIEYEKLFTALKKCYVSEGRLVQKCIELNQELLSSNNKLNNDILTIENLKKDLEMASSKLEANKAIESQQQVEMGNLQKEIEDLKQSLEAAKNTNQEDVISADKKIKISEREMELLNEKEELIKEIRELTRQLGDLQEKEKNEEEEIEELKDKMQELDQELQTRINENQKEIRKKDKLERELKQTQTTLTQKERENETLVQKIEDLKEEVERVQKEKAETKLALDKQQREKESLENRYQKIQIDFELQLNACDSLTNANNNKNAELKQREDEVNNLKTEIQKIIKMRDNANRKLKTMEDQRVELEQSRETLKLQMAAMEKDLDLSKKLIERDKKDRDDLMRERDAINQNLHKATSNTKLQSDQVKILEQTRHNLEMEMGVYKEEVDRLKKLILQLEKERDKFINESSDLTVKTLKLMDELKSKEVEIYDLKKKTFEIETKYRQQEQLFEAVRSDRNAYSRNLIEKQDEMNELKAKLKTMNHQSTQLKDEISNKSAAIIKEHSEFLKLEKERELLKAEMNQLKKDMGDRQASLVSMEKKEKMLTKQLSALEDERKHEMKKMEMLMKEKRSMANQLRKRNEEITLLYEKIDLQQSALSRGNTMYQMRTDDISVLKLEVKSLRGERDVLLKKVGAMNEMSSEIFKLEKELIRERTKCKAMEEELENPLNVHRWRKLEASDPNSFELIQKIQMLQKRLIRKTEEAVEKELLVQEKERMFAEMKRVLSRHFNPSLNEQVLMLQEALKEKNKQIKIIASEMNMNQHMNKEYKHEIDSLKEQMNDIKRKYLTAKKKEFLSTQDKMILPPLSRINSFLKNAEVVDNDGRMNFNNMASNEIH